MAEILDLSGLRLRAGEARRCELDVALAPLELGGQRYLPRPALVTVALDVSRTTAGGYALRLRFEAAVSGPCMRCLDDAASQLTVDVREVDVPGGGEELDSPYLEGERLNLEDWAHDGFALAVPDQVLCSSECLGLCPVCAARLRDAGPDHHHETPLDSRWAKLAELGLE